MRLLTSDRRHGHRFAPQFNRELLRKSLRARGIEYVFLGEELGGRPDGDAFYDDEGHVLYGEVTRTEPFRRALERFGERGAASSDRNAVQRGDPTHCHRRLLVTRVLVGRGVEVVHLRGDGETQTESELEQAVGEAQQTLFGSQEAVGESTRSVSTRPPVTSSVD